MPQVRRGQLPRFTRRTGRGSLRGQIEFSPDWDSPEPDAAGFEDWVLAHAPEFVDDRDAALREHAAGETVPLDEFLAELDQEE